MTTTTFQRIAPTQINHILSYAEKEKLKYKISESEDEFLYKKMVESEKSGKGNFNKVMEFLQA